MVVTPAQILIAILSVLFSLDPLKGSLFPIYFSKLCGIRRGILCLLVLTVITSAFLFPFIFIRFGPNSFELMILLSILLYNEIMHLLFDVHYKGSYKPSFYVVAKWFFINSLLTLFPLYSLLIALFNQIISFIIINSVSRVVYFYLANNNYFMIRRLSYVNLSLLYSLILVAFILLYVLKL